jgi:hypothetical protein
LKNEQGHGIARLYGLRDTDRSQKGTKRTMARPKKFPGTETRSVTFMIPSSDVAEVDDLAKQLAARYGIRVSRTDAFLKMLERGKAALSAELTSGVSP